MTVKNMTFLPPGCQNDPTEKSELPLPNVRKQSEESQLMSQEHGSHSSRSRQLGPCIHRYKLPEQVGEILQGQMHYVFFLLPEYPENLSRTFFLVIADS